MTTRRAWLFGTFLMAGCSRAPKEEPPKLPRKMGRWSLEYDPQSVLDLIPVAHAGWRYSYLGNPDVLLTLYAMPTETSAFDATQKWRAEKDKLAFYKGRYFGIASGEGVPIETLSAFATDVRTRLENAK